VKIQSTSTSLAIRKRFSAVGATNGRWPAEPFNCDVSGQTVILSETPNALSR
jgi:hypothetical protein